MRNKTHQPVIVRPVRIRKCHHYDMNDIGTPISEGFSTEVLFRETGYNFHQFFTKQVCQNGGELSVKKKSRRCRAIL